MSYTKKKNFAPYTYKYIMQYKVNYCHLIAVHAYFQDCTEALREMKDSDNITEHFDQALKEADTLQQLRMNNGKVYKQCISTVFNYYNCMHKH